MEKNSVIFIAQEPTNGYTQIILVEQPAKLLYNLLNPEEDLTAILPANQLGLFILTHLAETLVIYHINKDVNGTEISAIMNVLEPKSYITMVLAYPNALTHMFPIPSTAKNIANGLAMMKTSQSFITTQLVEQLAKILWSTEQITSGAFVTSLAKIPPGLIIILQMIIAMLHVMLLLLKFNQEIIISVILPARMKNFQFSTLMDLVEIYVTYLIR